MKLINKLTGKVNVGIWHLCCIFASMYDSFVED